MGNQPSQPSNMVPGANHSPLPIDPVPYAGPALEYRTLLVKAKMKQSFFGTRSSDIDSYMETLRQQYGEFYKLDSFYKVPYTVQASGFASALLSYQAIFSRPAAYVPSPEVWQLHVEPSKLEMSGKFGFSAKQVDSNMQDIYNQLAAKSNTGGRLICLECTGGANVSGFAKATFGINLFFNIPTHPNPILYTNIAYSNIMGIAYAMRGVDIQCDFLGALSMHLDQGWKLLDIIIPQLEAAGGMQGGKHQQRPFQMDVIWFFEKELHRFQGNDMTPLYQVCMVEIEMKISRGFTSVSSDLDMAPVLSQMGASGWSLVCLLDTPKMHASGMTFINCSIAFFQRPVVHGAPAPTVGPPPSFAPPHSGPPPEYKQ